MIQFSEKINKKIGPNFFKLKLTKPKLFQTEHTRQLACLPSFCELVFTAFRVAGVDWLSATAAESHRAFVGRVFVNFGDKNKDEDRDKDKGI